MKAAVCRRYGPPEVVGIEEVPAPVPGTGEVLVRIRAASVNPADLHMMRGRPVFLRLFMGLRAPKRDRPGVDMAGEVEAVGAGVTRFRPGDAVFGACPGAIAEIGCAAEDRLAAKPANLSFAEAGGVAASGLTALQALRDKAEVREGQKVLINGAAGGVGSLAVQIAKSLGAEVTGVCGPAGVDLVRSLGADHVIDYGREDFTLAGLSYDCIFDLVGNYRFGAIRRALAPNGVYVPSGGPHPDGSGVGGWMVRMLGAFIASKFSSRRIVFFIARLRGEDLDALRLLLESGQVKAVVDTCYPLAETAAALRRLATRHAHGKVIINMDA